MTNYSVERLTNDFLTHPQVGRATFLSPEDIERVTGRSLKTIANDKAKRKIKPINDEAGRPKFAIEEVFAYLVRVGLIVNPSKAANS